MATLAEFNKTSTPWIEMWKCSHLKSEIERDYPSASSAKSTAISNLDTLIGQWQTAYDTELAAATLDDFPSSVTSQVTALQTAYTNYSTPDDG